MEFQTQQCDTVNSIYDASNVPSEFTESNLVNFSEKNVAVGSLEDSVLGVVSHKQIPMKIKPMP